MHDHEHEEHCGCGHEHHHDHDEHCGCGHEHHHDHDEHCGCGHDHHHHGHELGEQIIHSAYTFSHEGVLNGEPVTLVDAMDRVEKALLTASERIEVEGIIPGHLKALLKAGDVHAVLSVTRPGHCDRTCPQLPADARTWALTVNLISAVCPEHEPDDLVLPLFG